MILRRQLGVLFSIRGYGAAITLAKNRQMSFSSDTKSEFDKFEERRTNVLAESEFTEFQKTFGFHEDIARVQKESQQKERRKYMTFTAGALVAVGVLSSVLMIGFDPKVEKSIKQAYLVHSTNLKIKSNKQL